MYYKIVNQDSKVYQDMKSLLLKEEEIEANNRKMLDEKIPYKWEVFYGSRGQQDFLRTSRYSGFRFLNPEEVDTKVWREKDGMWFPNRRTKAGREMLDFLNNGMEKSWYNDPLKILGCGYDLPRFKFPFIEQCDDVLVVFLDDGHIPVSEDVIEITSKEFNEIRDNFYKKNDSIR
mgnify:CR=1 FL=1